MKAWELLKKYIKEGNTDVGVIAISRDNKLFWFHVKEDEDVPEDYDIAIHIRE